MLMALDNLYSKCGESPIRIRHDYEEFKNEKETKKGKKKTTGQKKTKEKTENCKR
jgi:hypothetical protein